MLLDLIRDLVPIKYRQSWGLWTAHQAGRSKVLLYPYMFLICGVVPRNLKMLPHDRCVINYKNHRILMPRDGIFTSWEVLQDEIYEKFYQFKEGDVVIDVGAYVGMFTVKASLSVGKGKVIAIEPASSNLKYLKKNTVNLDNVTIVPVAVSSSKGIGTLVLSSASPCHSLVQNNKGVKETVKLDTLDNIVARLDIKPDFIKIDAEGAELEILKGAVNTLKTDVKLAIASYHNLANGERELPYISRLLISQGFKVEVEGGYIYATK